jgi:hypothetical protein
VEIGVRGTRAVEVVSGLAEGDRVAAPFPGDIRDGQAVRVSERPKAEP